MLCLAATAVLATPALAQDHGSAEEAVALVKKAISFYQAQGREKAFAAFSDPAGGFQTKDLYIFVQDLSGGTLAHKNGALVGKNIKIFKDADGKAFGSEILDACNGKGSGWTDYKWSNAVTQKIEQKSTYIERAGDLCFGAGIYKG